MPYLFAVFFSLLAQLIKPLVGRVLLALGLQVVAYKGLTTLFDYVIDRVLGGLTGGDWPAVALSIMSNFRIAEVTAILSGATLTALTIKGLKDGVLEKLM